MEQVRLLSMTTVLTLLVWASADSLVNETVRLPVAFELTPPPTAPAMRVAVADDAPSFEIEVSGPRKVIEELKSRVPLRIRITVPERPTGAATMILDRRDVREALAGQSSEFGKLSVTGISPERLPTVIDHMVRRDVAVVMKNLTRSYDVEPQLSPSRVSVTMRESELARLPSGEALQIDISSEVERLLADRAGGVSTKVPVSLDAGRYGPDATLTPNSVEVTATVQAQRTTVQIGTVPILLAVSFANLERALRPVGRDGTPLALMTQTITVSGRTEHIRRLQQGETRAYGVIHLKQEDLDRVGELNLVTPEYRLPDGVSLAETPPPIEFKLVAPATGPGN